ncbi:LPS export ABC transporter periplasmic protein LptC [Synechococcus sp. CS-1325]|uniref:LPS export ABC transporter periplasmic protein LptC n=1 Tax=unclassified Synechococcus TaxID=2626047 RepID=UPI000DB3E815|nr:MULTISPECIES: LPS export ABC transporter periplasmic protein LptC [unclassified Synechococcus]PZV00146.1 MAG: LPS export ABC transporter periplasmic protein LptC [Cyanobium sp.]MCT0199345.1 LPS export ABC transporter periplasmic protein LptC [Synechococcus sp. CS-1325]MCT0214402.1 LPS export ABC transporter periplasmic protein LptC [Synechococcus sp. CS-1326]MCT0231832.1 LPS export ABC transporter periplasmic protein LptC [Synechococcus sp. CS-1324]MCT0233295.1 LPS export ABC transporter pe
MSRLLLILLTSLLGSLPLLSCSRTPAAKPSPPQPFVFRSLDLRQQDARGRPSWELISPLARYDLQGRRATVQQPRGVIYAGGKPSYRIEAKRGTVLNDGELITLEGAVRIQVLGPKPSVISGDRVRWTPKAQRISIDQRPMLVDRSSRLTARTALFLIDQSKLELRGDTRLISQKLDLRVARADWFANTGVLLAAGPVLGTRRLGKGPAQTLTASALEGNTRDEVLDALAPVRFTDPAQNTVVDAQRVRWTSSTQRLSTLQPFFGRSGKLQVRGESLEVQLDQQWALIPTGCDLRQPGEKLLARECVYNWDTRWLMARGGVVLTRDANQQITRSTEALGRVGGDGLATFSTPGGRVNSQLRIPPASDRSPDQPERSRPPVVF